MKLEQLYKEVNLIDFDLPCLVYRKCSPGLSKMQSWSLENAVSLYVCLCQDFDNRDECRAG